MKLNRWYLIVIVAVVMFWAVKGYAGRSSMTTYYPAATGYYDRMNVRSTLIVPCHAAGSAAALSMPNNALWIEGAC